MNKHFYDYDVDLDGSSAAARVIRLCGQNKKVLEIGAGPGSITRHLTKNNCDVVAAEIDPEAIEILKPFCRKVYSLDLNDGSWPTFLETEGLFDVAIAADVLEHVSDPLNVLKQMCRFLNCEGYIILSIPHVGHSVISASILIENFEYRDWGLLDRTHIRFFGMHNIQQLYEQAGLAIVEAEFVVKTPEMTEFASAWNSLSPDVQVALQSNRFGNVYQVVAVGVPNARTDQRLTITEMPVVVPEGASQHVKLIAFFLTQFHPIPENDKWWGKGFTEWTNATKAEPLFFNHYQPHLPTELGFYDLRLRDARHNQITLAKEYGIYGFCYYYYWFSGERLLEKPLEDMLNDPDSDMPFCLCWANENWTRRWDGREQEILLDQKYLPEDDLTFIKDLMPYLKDKRYIRYNGRPLLIVYSPQQLPNARKTVKIWREYCALVGLEQPLIIAALTHHNWEYHRFGFDGSVEFPPHNLNAPNLRDIVKENSDISGYIFDYEELAKTYLSRYYGTDSDANCFRTVLPSWDNTARTGNRACLALNGTPENYEYWLSETIRKTREDRPSGDRLVFINAWNEWAEGCHLEPDRKYGRAFLEATVRAKKGMSKINRFIHIGTNLYKRPTGEVSATRQILKLASDALLLECRQARWTFQRLLGMKVR
jgi:2-polyprenyl-3-methyl-5-hydroxy-6-metoxy-1,4-benzoquinol methylase